MWWMQLFIEQAIEIWCCLLLTVTLKWKWEFWILLFICLIQTHLLTVYLAVLQKEKQESTQSYVKFKYTIFYVLQLPSFLISFHLFIFRKILKNEMQNATKKFIFCVNVICNARYVIKVHKFIYTLDTCCHSHCAIKSICTITLLHI